MSVETLLTYALAMIGGLLGMNLGLVVYVFQSLKTEVRSVATEVSDLHRNRAKLVHRDDCRVLTERVHARLDEQEAHIHDLNERLARVETTLDLECP